MDQEVSQRRADEGAINSHFGHSRADIVTTLRDIFGNPRGKYFLQS